ncbi:Imm7 family immunity protein [Marinomonas transparens]|uniref:Immunity protein 7 n=1 Tax=Marinomonas transparens TaxID=2795388 RepID=A0A934MY55_9GAMM|nr:Imm7 family immunity protein [Marinomonas transparens]MBJ7540054.1 hypothetical protein [Marinomonas transparens]
MFLYYGWLTIEAEEHESNYYSLQNFDLIQEKINEFNALYFSENTFTLKTINGYKHLLVSGADNRKGEFWNLIYKELFWIAEIMKGSYGVIYTRDTANYEGNIKSNEFEVYVMKRGCFELSNIPDPYLSPCAPKIEDA